MTNEYKSVSEVFVNEDKPLDFLKTELHITSEISDCGTYALLDYNQIYSPKTHPVVIQCRSLIVKIEDGSTVAMKFPRFFNYGEALEITEKVNFKNCEITMKEDGSVIGLWKNKYLNRWEISTRGRQTANGEFVRQDSSKSTFRALFLESIECTEREFQDKMNSLSNQDVTFVLEFCHPEHRIVTKYEVPTIFYLTTNEGANEYPGLHLNDLINLFPIIVPVPSFQTTGKGIDEVMQLLDEKCVNLKEGFVVKCLDTGTRVKIKTSQYVAVHHIRGNLGIPRSKDIANLIRANEHAEFLVYFPEYQPLFTDMKNNMETYARAILATANDIMRMYDDKKSRALYLKELKLRNIATGLIFGSMSKAHFGHNRVHMGALQECLDALTAPKFEEFWTAANEYCKPKNL